MTEPVIVNRQRAITDQQIDGIIELLVQIEEYCALVRCALETEEPRREALNGAINVLDNTIAIAEGLRTNLPTLKTLPS